MVKTTHICAARSNLDVQIFIITGGKFSCELQHSSTIILAAIHQLPVLTGVDGREVATYSVPILHGKGITTSKLRAFVIMQ